MFDSVTPDRRGPAPAPGASQIRTASRLHASYGARWAVTLTLTMIALLAFFASTAYAVPPPVPQTPLKAGSLPQFVDPLPTIADMGGPIVAGSDPIRLTMREFQTKILPTGFVPANGQPYVGTYVWGYLQDDQTTRNSYLGPVIIGTRGTPTTMQYINDLGTVDSTNVLAYKNSVDQTLHWANPLNLPMIMGNPNLYNGPIPATVHLHGGEVPPQVDGGPDSWYTSNGIHGPGYFSQPGIATPPNSAVYTYPNTGEAAAIWFHDHTLGATRLNVYAGLAGAYLITDPDLTLAPGLGPIGLQRATPNEDTIVPLVVQDRMFDTNGQLYFPNVGINPEHPYWVPEFLGDAIAVNGKVWPYKNVQAQRYRFLFINGSNARTYQMAFQVNGNSSKKAPVMWQIGADGGYLDAPARLANLLLMPGERADVIVDFAGLAPGTTLLLTNTAKAPYPGGAPVNGSTTGRVMQFRVVAGAPAVDDSFNPATPGATIKGASDATVRLTDPVTGTIAAGVTVAKTRSVTLNEVMGMRMKVNGIQYPGGPLEILLNNTMWDAATTETPQEGTTEVWEFVNLTADAHPMHLHLVQFQLLNRQALDLKRYNAAYNAAFPGALFTPGSGPPLNYDPSPASGNKFGGNPDVTPFLVGPAVAPAPNEAGWKDTIMAPPGTVTRIAVRWAPTDLPNTTAAANAFYQFDPSGDGLYEYVWHCHIVDHEDNEMMRRDDVQPNPLAIRTP
jgi:spore coat protein A